MLTSTARLLELLELLQARPLTTGREIAAALDVDPRTVRRYIEALQELGIPIEGQRGVGGGYRVRPGYRLPPLMLSEDEAVVVVLGLLAARRDGLDGERGSVDGALTKIHRVLPNTLRRRAEALETTLAFTRAARAGAPVAGESVLLLADAIRRRRRIKTEYRTHAGERSRRELSPHGLVFHAGRWYLAAFDHLRDDLRTFRVDRMRAIALLPEAADPAPEGFDPAEHVTSRSCSISLSMRRGVVFRRRSRPWPRPTREPSCACRWAPSSGWRQSSPASAATSRSALRTSYGSTSVSSPGD